MCDVCIKQEFGVHNNAKTYKTYNIIREYDSVPKILLGGMAGKVRKGWYVPTILICRG